MDLRKGSPSTHCLQIVKIVLLVVFVLAFIFALNRFRLSHYFPIKTVRVYGVQEPDQHQIEYLLMPLVNRGFFNVNVDSIHDQLLQLPWVANTFVRRNWPDRIDITLIEKNAIGIWNKESLLSDKGEVFLQKKDIPLSHLPQFIGPLGKQVVMLQYFCDINRLLLPLHAKISYLELTPYFNWKLTLDNGITLYMGHKDILTRLDHFVKVYPKIVGNRASDVDYIDLRYPNGIAVQWKS